MQWLRYALKKNDIIWEFFPNVGPPPFWEPLIQKKILVFILHFRTLGTFLVFSKKLKICQYFYIYKTLFEQCPNPHLGPPETTVKRSWAVQSIYFGRQTSAAIISSVIIKLNNSGQSLKMTTGDFKKRRARPIQFFCLLHISKSLLPSVQIKSMLYVKYTHSLFCLKLRNIVCFPGSEEKRVSSTHYLDWQHYKVTMGLMPW